MKFRSCLWGIHSFETNRTVWKILIFDFFHFLTFFSTHQKTLLGDFEIFLITGLNEIEFWFFAQNFFKNGPNSIFFFWNFCYFTYFLEKTTKNLFEVFLYAIFEFENFNLVIETVWIFLAFLINFYFSLLFILQILRPGW